jgi:hypothetical protein
MSDNFEFDIDPKNREEILQRDRDFRESVSRMNQGEKRTLLETLEGLTGYSKAHLYKCIKPDSSSENKNFRTLFSYGKSKLPTGLDVPQGVSSQDVAFQLKLRIGEATIKGIEAGGARDRVQSGTRNGESTRLLGNAVTGLDVDTVGKYVLNEKLFSDGNGLEPKIFFQSGGGVYFTHWHDSPGSSGSGFDAEQERDYLERGLIDPNEGWY